MRIGSTDLTRVRSSFLKLGVVYLGDQFLEEVAELACILEEHIAILAIGKVLI